MNIPLGYEVDTGRPVSVPLNHMGVLGQTQQSGKTTTLEALVMRSERRAIAFITKPGEKSFRQQTTIQPFFSESTIEEYWRYVISILEYSSGKPLGRWEASLVMKLCQDYEKATSRIGMPDTKGRARREKVKYEWEAPDTLEGLLQNIEAYMPHARSADEMVLIALRNYLSPAIAEIKKANFTSELKLAPGINVMNLTELSDGLKTLVIRSVIEHVHKKMKNTIVIVPEAWKFIPEGRTTPVKLALEGLIREGAGLKNFVWIDSQDLRGVDKKLLRSVIVWLFGVQRQRNEVATTLDSMPDQPKPSATEVMQLKIGQFYACYGSTLVKTYVQPAGMENEHAKAIAVGDEEPESWRGISAALSDSLPKGSSVPLVGKSGDERLEDSAETGPNQTPRIEGRVGTTGNGAVLRIDSGGGSDEMWKEKYEDLEAQHLILKQEHKVLIDAHDLLAARLARLENLRGVSVQGFALSKEIPRFPGASVHQPAEPAAEHIPTMLGKNGTDSAAAPKGEFGSDLLQKLREMAERDPVILRILAERPELLVTRQVKTIDVNAGQLKGALGVLIADKFFDTCTEFADVRKELIRRGALGVKAPNQQISQALQGLVEWGFLTKEDSGYQAVPGMKINIVETR